MIFIWKTLLVNARVPRGSIVGPTLVLLYINNLMMLSVTLLCMLMILLCPKCNQASDLWQQLELTSELESDLQDTVDWGRKWHFDFSAGKTQVILFDWSNNTGAIGVKIDGSVLEENYLLRYCGWLSLLNWIGALTLSLLVKLHSGKLEL